MCRSELSGERPFIGARQFSGLHPAVTLKRAMADEVRPLFPVRPISVYSEQFIPSLSREVELEKRNNILSITARRCSAPRPVASFALLLGLSYSAYVHRHKNKVECQVSCQRTLYFYYIISRAFVNPSCTSGAYFLCFLRTRFKYPPVYEPLVFATSSGVPFATTFPPATPPSGPISIT